MNAANPALSHHSVPAMPSLATAGKLFAGGLAGLLVWEIWARWLTPIVVGGPLEPPALIISLVKHWTGFALPLLPATALHYAVGIIGYPLAYWVISRGFSRWAPVLDFAVWIIFTAFMGYLAMIGKVSTISAGLWLMVTILSATRFINKNKVLADAISWGNFTWFNALGIMAPLAGLPFLLLVGADKLSLMSWGGHVIYGAVAVVILELWIRSKA